MDKQDLIRVIDYTKEDIAKFCEETIRYGRSRCTLFENSDRI